MAVLGLGPSRISPARSQEFLAKATLFTAEDAEDAEKKWRSEKVALSDLHQEPDVLNQLRMAFTVA